MLFVCSKTVTRTTPPGSNAIRSAQHWIHFETYILHDDKIGKVFAEALCERARAGVKVRLLVDWLGSLLKIGAGILADVAAGRRRGAQLRLSHDRFAAWLGLARSPQVARHRRPRRIRQRALRRRRWLPIRRPAAKRSAIPA